MFANQQTFSITINRTWW